MFVLLGLLFLSGQLSAVAQMDLDSTEKFRISPVKGNTVTRGGRAEFFVTLTKEPTSKVVIQLSSSDESEGTVDPEQLEFFYLLSL